MKHFIDWQMTETEWDRQISLGRAPSPTLPSLHSLCAPISPEEVLGEKEVGSTDERPGGSPSKEQSGFSQVVVILLYFLYSQMTLFQAPYNLSLTWPAVPHDEEQVQRQRERSLSSQFIYTKTS